jgi:hypothetical protein
MTYENWHVLTATIDSCDWEAPLSHTPSPLFVGHFIVAFSYAVDGNRYSGEFRSLHEWEKGTDITILYNPQNPGECVAMTGEEKSERRRTLIIAAIIIVAVWILALSIGWFIAWPNW